MDKNEGNYFFGLGIICQLLGFFFFLTFWLMYGAIFLYLIGTVFILISKQRWYFKILSVSPMLFSMGVIINALTFERYLLPEGFKGPVAVITDKEIGEEKEFDFYWRLYKIPSSGILFTKFNQNEGYPTREFFQIEKSGKLKKLGTLDHRDYIESWVINPPKTEPSRDSFAVFTPELEFNFDTRKYYTVFTVGKYKDFEAWNYFPEGLIDSTRNALKKNLMK